MIRWKILFFSFPFILAFTLRWFLTQRLREKKTRDGQRNKSNKFKKRKIAGPCRSFDWQKRNEDVREIGCDAVVCHEWLTNKNKASEIRRVRRNLHSDESPKIKNMVVACRPQQRYLSRQLDVACKIDTLMVLLCGWLKHKFKAMFVYW